MERKKLKMEEIQQKAKPAWSVAPPCKNNLPLNYIQTNTHTSQAHKQQTQQHRCMSHKRGIDKIIRTNFIMS